MGLDMYLYMQVPADVVIEGEFAKEDKYQWSTDRNVIDKYPWLYQFCDDDYFVEKHGLCLHVLVFYWRKANAIHKYFVDNFQDGIDECQESYAITTNDLRKLLEVVDEVLEDITKAETLLPPESGFFFGSTDIDEWYLEDLRKTKRLQTLIDLTEKYYPNNQALFYYHSSW